TLSSASGTNAQTVTAGTAITNIAYSTTGATGATISGLPAGVTGSWASNIVTISGTPTATGTFNYTITMTGGCTGGNNTQTGSITVNSGGGGGNFNIQTTIGSFNSSTCAVGDTIVLPITVNMASGISTAAISMAIDYDTTKLRCISSVTNLNTNIATGFLSNCGFFTNQSSNPPFTASSRRQFRAAWFNLVPVAFNGLMFNLRFVVVATGNSSVKWDVATPGNCEYADELADVIPNCSFVDGSVTCGTAVPVCGITLSSASGTNSQSICQGSAITNITYATTAATGATVTGLPAGVTGVWASNAVTISGTPTAAGTFNYTVTLTGCTGGTSTATGTIT
ncbi:MAG: cohesin domain-containing protein, partial [Bacteroidota bacterium]